MSAINSINTSSYAVHDAKGSNFSMWDITSAFGKLNEILTKATIVTSSISQKLSEDDKKQTDKALKNYKKELKKYNNDMKTLQIVMTVAQVAMVGMAMGQTSAIMGGLVKEEVSSFLSKETLFKALPAASMVVPMLTGANSKSPLGAIGTMAAAALPAGAIMMLLPWILKNKVGMSAEGASEISQKSVNATQGIAAILQAYLMFKEGEITKKLAETSKDYQLSRVDSQNNQNEVNLLGKKVIGFLDLNTTLANGVNGALSALGNGNQYVGNKLKLAIKQQK